MFPGWYKQFFPRKSQVSNFPNLFIQILGVIIGHDIPACHIISYYHCTWLSYMIFINHHNQGLVNVLFLFWDFEHHSQVSVGF
jgi:hypothetical protein